MTMQSENLNELFTALSKAQGEMKGAFKDATNPHFRSKYADLEGVWDACGEALSKYGLCVTQEPDWEGEIQYLKTRLGHISGQYIVSRLRLPLNKPGPQELGSCMTYCRRFALASMVGVYPTDEKDDDGEKAEKSFRDQNLNMQPIKIKPMQTISKDQLVILEEQMIGLPKAASQICAKYNLKHIHELPEAYFSHVVSILKEQGSKKERIAAQVEIGGVPLNA